MQEPDWQKKAGYLMFVISLGFLLGVGAVSCIMDDEEDEYTPSVMTNP